MPLCQRTSEDPLGHTSPRISHHSFPSPPASTSKSLTTLQRVAEYPDLQPPYMHPRRPSSQSPKKSIFRPGDLIAATPLGRLPGHEILNASTLPMPVADPERRLAVCLVICLDQRESSIAPRKYQTRSWMLPLHKHRSSMTERKGIWRVRFVCEESWIRGRHDRPTGRQGR